MLSDLGKQSASLPGNKKEFCNDCRTLFEISTCGSIEPQ
jgi:hypothetical protein